MNINPKEGRNRTEKIKDFIALPKKIDVVSDIPLDDSLPNFSSVSFLMTLFKWLIKDPVFVKKLFELLKEKISGTITKDEIPGWYTGERHKAYGVINDGLLIPHHSYRDLFHGPSFILSSSRYIIRYVRSYNVFSCFSNYEAYTPNMKKCTPMDFLNELKNEKYVINPNMRSMVFTSLLYYHENINSCNPANTLSESTGNKQPSQQNETHKDNISNYIVLKRNKQLVEKTVFDFRYKLISKFMYDDVINISLNAVYEHFPAYDKPNVPK